jgi:hypothetical protein
MGCDFVRVQIYEHLGNEPSALGGTFVNNAGAIHSFNCPGLDPNRDAHCFVYGLGMHGMHYFKLNGKGPKGTGAPEDGWWIEPSVNPNSNQSQLRPGIIFGGKGHLKETGNTIQVYSNPNNRDDDFLIYYILILYPTK